LRPVYLIKATRKEREMRMYLSSFRLSNRPDALQELVGSDRRAAIVNALDNFPEQRARWLQTQSDALIKLGLSVWDWTSEPILGATAIFAA
jgi:hypothetical protein